jgi:hypothetical protein
MTSSANGENERRSQHAWRGAAKVAGGVLLVAGGVALFGVTGGIVGASACAGYAWYWREKSRREQGPS